MTALEALREIDRIVRVPTKKTAHKTARDHFMADFDAIRRIICAQFPERDQ